MFTYTNFSEAYLGVLDAIFFAGQESSSRIGNQKFIRHLTYETEVTLEEDNILDRELRGVIFPGRSPNWEYAKAFAAFVLSGSTVMPQSLIDLNPMAAKFDSSQTNLEAYGLPGNFSMFYGPRIAKQVLEVGLELAVNRDTRRAYISVLDGINDNQLLAPLRDGLDKVEYPCTIGFNFSVEDDMLDIAVDMRSQNMVSVWPYDFYIATELLKAVAKIAGLQTGKVVGHVHNAHIYERDFAHVSQLLDANGF